MKQEIIKLLEIISRHVEIPDDKDHGANHWINVYCLAMNMQAKLGGDRGVIKWSSILHDIGKIAKCSKFTGSSFYLHGDYGASLAYDILKKENIDVNRYAVCDIIRKHSYPLRAEYLEMQIIMDSDKLDRVRLGGVYMLNFRKLDLIESITDFLPLALVLNGFNVEEEISKLKDKLENDRSFLK